MNKRFSKNCSTKLMFFRKYILLLHVKLLKKAEIRIKILYFQYKRSKLSSTYGDKTNSQIPFSFQF